MSQKTDQDIPHKSFGSFLREERLRHDISIEALAEATGISIDNLHAMEEGDRRKLPADVFLKGFIRLYCNRLHIDAAHALELFDAEWGISNGTPKNTDLLNTESMAESPSFFSSQFIILLCLLLILVLFGYFSYHTLLPMITKPSSPTPAPTVETMSPPEETEIIYESAQSLTKAEKIEEPQIDALSVEDISTPQDEPEPAAESVPETEPDAAPALIDDASPHDDQVKQSDQEEEEGDQEMMTEEPSLPAEAGQSPDGAAVPPFHLQARFIETTWMRIQIDDEQEREFTFQPGETHTWTAQSSVQIFVGNAGGIKLSVNEEPYPINGKSGEAVQIHLPQPE